MQSKKRVVILKEPDSLESFMQQKKRDLQNFNHLNSRSDNEVKQFQQKKRDTENFNVLKEQSSKEKQLMQSKYRP